MVNIFKEFVTLVMWVGLTQSADGFKSKTEVSPEQDFSVSRRIINFHLSVQPAGLPCWFQIGSPHRHINQLLNMKYRSKYRSISFVLPQGCVFIDVREQGREREKH